MAAYKYIKMYAYNWDSFHQVSVLIHELHYHQ